MPGSRSGRQARWLFDDFDVVWGGSTMLWALGIFGLCAGKLLVSAQLPWLAIPWAESSA